MLRNLNLIFYIIMNINYKFNYIYIYIKYKHHQNHFQTSPIPKRNITKLQKLIKL